jgi:signal transduction histidine kinase/CheY-like chemotaxis protein
MNTGPGFQWLVYQQDYLWFLVALGWATLAGAWWRLGRAEKRLGWLPWAALAAFLTAGLEVSQLITPVVLKPFAAPWLAWGLTLGGIHALLASGLWWSLAGQEKWPRWKPGLVCALAALAAGLRYSQPIAGSAGLTLLVLAPAFGLVRHRRLRGAGGFALLALPATVLLATNGPLAESLGSSHRYTEISPYGLAASAAWLISLVAAGWALARHLPPSAESADDRRDLRLLVWVQAGWLVVGLGLAAIMSHWARNQFEDNLLSRVRMAAELIDRQDLASHLGPAFRVDEFNSSFFLTKNFPVYRSDYLAKNTLAKVAATLSVIELANPDTDWAEILTMRCGQLLIFANSSRMPDSIIPGTNGRFGRPDAATWQSWSERRAEIVGPVDFYYGYVVQARAPLVAKDHRMLGWLILDLNVAHWLHAQVEARLLAFLVIGLGSILLAVSWQLRVRERVRAAVRHEADTAQAANRIKTAFLAKVSHELRTPIQSLLGYSELLRRKVTGDPKAAGWLAALQQHGELMTRLVNDLIDLSAVEAGAFQLAPRPVEPANVVAQTVESFRPRAEARNLTLACFVDPSLPAWIRLDGERFRQVIINLVGNALKFTDRGGVTVALRQGPGDQLVLTVRDTGPGIAPAEQVRLFVAFSRLDLTSDKEGTGLGLALSFGICRAMGGDLTVVSDGVTGSCFTATFEAPATAAPDGPESPEPLATLRGRRILVVDDNPLVRELFIAYLTEQGASCAAAATGAEALAQVTAGSFDSIILDLALPDGDGTEFAAPLRAAAPGARLIGVSAHASTSDRARVLAAGMDAFLTKPVPLSALAAAAADGLPTNGAVFRTADALRERLSRQFVGELPACRDKLAAAIETGDWPRVQALAHHLKNSAVVVRDDALFDVCTGLEQAAAAGDGPVTLLWWARCGTRLEHWAVLPPGSLFASRSPLEKNNQPETKP